MSSTIQPYYSLIDPPIPASTILSDVRINKKIDIDNNARLQSLKEQLDTFSNRKSYWVEVTILDRLYYKNLNQQRPFHRFKRAMEIRRLAKRLKSLQVEQELERLYKSFWNVKQLDKCKGKWNYIPSKESISYTMHRLISAALLLDRIKVTLVEVYRDNSTLLKLEHFVSMAIVYMSVCSRLFKLCHTWINQIEECYHLLYTWSESFPSGLKQKEERLFLEKNNLECKADTLKFARSEYSKTTMRSKSSSQHKIHLETYISNQAIADKVNEIKKELGANNSIDDDEMDFEDLGEVIQR